MASGQSDPRLCPTGWQTAFDRADLRQTGRSGGNYQRKTLKVDLPSSAQVMRIDQRLQHPKFCWKEASSSQWACHHSDPWQGAWFRFESFRPDQASPMGVGVKRYTVVAQNESHDRPRNAMLVVCYQNSNLPFATARPTFRPGVVR
jgi:hypothetical protein